MSQAKMLLVACSGEETTLLAQNIYDVLRQDYELENQVEILYSASRAKIESGTAKNHLHPLVGDYFPDGEVQEDIGRNTLKDIIRGKHVVLVEHLLTPNRFLSAGDTQRISVNDHYMAVRGYLDLISKVNKKDDAIPQTTLAAPYLTYVRSHSIEKYEQRGFFQFDSLRATLKDYRNNGLDVLITIDPHSEKAAQISSELGLDFHAINPFQSARAINPAKLGLKEDKAKKIMPKLRPFQELFSLFEKDANHLYVVSVDDGTEKRVENFVERAFSELSPEQVYTNLVYFDKDRISYDNSVTKFKRFSNINEKKIDAQGTYIIIDDMISTGGTSAKVAKILKSFGAKRVEVWVSHAVTTFPQISQVNGITHIDKIVSLDTIPQHPDLKIAYLNSSADLLAAELYKVHQKLIVS